MRKLWLLPLAIVLVAAVAYPAAAATTTNPANAPTGTHLQAGTPACTVDPSTQLVTCSSFELAGVGNANATGALGATYTATVDCTNHGGMLVPVKSTTQSAPTTTGNLAPKNGKLTVTSLNSGPVPTARQFENQATCPNGNWTKSLQGNSVALSSFTYTLTFAGFPGPYITITGP